MYPSFSYTLAASRDNGSATRTDFYNPDLEWAQATPTGTTPW